MKSIYLNIDGDKCSVSSKSNDSHLQIKIIIDSDNADIEAIEIQYFQDKWVYDDAQLYHNLLYSIREKGDSLKEKISNFTKSLGKEEVQIIIREYSNYIEDGIILDGFLAGIGAYLTFLVLNESNKLDLSFNSNMANKIEDYNIFNRHMFRFINLHLYVISNSDNKTFSKLALFVQNFINIWELSFADGPLIPSHIENKMYVEIIANHADNINKKIVDNYKEHERNVSILQDKIEKIDNILDKTLKTRMLQVVDRDLTAKIDEELAEKAKNISEQLINKSLSERYDNIERRLQNIEDHIKILYNKLEKV